MELVVASSSVDNNIGCWDLHSGIEQLRYRSCASPPHGLLSVSQHFLASSQLRENPSSSTAPIFFWSWDKPQVQVKSFPAEPIGPLVSDSDGSYIIGGGSSGAIYLWEIASGKLLNKWNAHYRSVTCLTLSDDESLLISGSEDGSIKVWALLMIFDDTMKESGEDIYMYSFLEHVLRVTSVISGHGLCNSIIISSSEDRTCKIWSLSKGSLLRSITFPSIIDAIAMDPGEYVFYAGGRDGKIYVAALNAEWDSVRNYGKFIMGHLSDHRHEGTDIWRGFMLLMSLGTSPDALLYPNEFYDILLIANIRIDLRIHDPRRILGMYPPIRPITRETKIKICFIRYQTRTASK
ncbi:Protein SPA1-RELATED 4 [Platanthera guangdongensis]|uniref:Protein SPA1-RELATED 4 n=1 Tax=Platanthera guangdongensis TaxID=2320717 RepID=A0ABR2MSB5_9ASPA